MIRHMAGQIGGWRGHPNSIATLHKYRVSLASPALRRCVRCKQVAVRGLATCVWVHSGRRHRDTPPAGRRGASWKQWSGGACCHRISWPRRYGGTWPDCHGTRESRWLSRSSWHGTRGTANPWHGPGCGGRPAWRPGRDKKTRDSRDTRDGTTRDQRDHACPGNGRGPGTDGTREQWRGRCCISRGSTGSIWIRDPSAGAQARVSAARTLAEIQGLVGRHQARPDRASETPVDELSREDLVLELSRLRSRVAVP